MSDDEDMFFSPSAPSLGSLEDTELTQSSCLTPSAPTDFSDSQNLPDSSEFLTGSPERGKDRCLPLKIHRVKIEFLGENGQIVSPTRYSDNTEIVDIIYSLVRSNNEHYKKSTVKKMCSSTIFKSEIQNTVLHSISDSFSSFLSNPAEKSRNI